MKDNFGEDRGFFGRRLGRPLSPAKKLALDNLLKECGVVAGDAPLSLPADKKIVLEIGFGYGERLAEMMRREPEHYYIGLEPFINGMAAFASEEDVPRNNLQVHMDDAIPFLKRIPDACVDMLYVLNPDPWHKTRHHKRRIVGPDNLPEFARVLKKSGIFICTTDVPYLAEWMVSHTSNSPDFEWTAQSKADWENPPQGWIHTRYETKGAKGAEKMGYYLFERNP